MNIKLHNSHTPKILLIYKCGVTPMLCNVRASSAITRCVIIEAA